MKTFVEIKNSLQKSRDYDLELIKLDLGSSHFGWEICSDTVILFTFIPYWHGVSKGWVLIEKETGKVTRFENINQLKKHFIK